MQEIKCFKSIDGVIYEDEDNCKRRDSLITEGLGVLVTINERSKNYPYNFQGMTIYEFILKCANGGIRFDLDKM